MEAEPTVLGIAGSFRGGSLNARLLARAAALVPAGARFELFDGLDELPHFSQEREGELTPEPVLAMRRQIAAAAAVLVATPEYNSSMPGALKNALDWASRPPGESVLDGKPAAVVGASPGRFGAVRAQAAVRKVLTAIGAEVIDQELPVPRALEAFDEAGALREAELDRSLAELVAALVELAAPHVPAEHDAAADYSIHCQRLEGAA